MNKTLNLLSGVVALGLLGAPLGAQANQIALLGTVDGITLTGTGTLVNVSIAAGTGDGAVFQATGFPNVTSGTYTLGAVAFTAGPKFFGTLTVTTSTGSPQFTSTFPMGANDRMIDLTTTALGGGQTLDQLVAASGTVTVGISSGEVAVPGPIVGAGLPGLVMACGGLIAFARRRRKLVV